MTKSDVVEIIDTLGQDSEDKAVNPVIEYNRELEKKSQKKEDDFLEKLSDINKKEIYYRSILAEARIRLLEFSPPRGFDWIFRVSDKGLALFIKSPDGQQYGHGMKILGEPLHDARGIDALISKGLDYMEVLNGHLQ